MPKKKTTKTGATTPASPGYIGTLPEQPERSTYTVVGQTTARKTTTRKAEAKPETTEKQADA